MPMDDRKRRVLRAIVTLYGADGEPVGSGLLAEHFAHAVSSATLRNEMAALTKLGLLEQPPHLGGPRAPCAKGYRYYIDNLLGAPAQLSAQDRRLAQADVPRDGLRPRAGWRSRPQRPWRTGPATRPWHDAAQRGHVQRPLRGDAGGALHGGGAGGDERRRA